MESYNTWSYDWLPAPGITFSRFMLWHVFILHTFRLSNHTALYGYTLSFQIHSSFDRDLGCLPFLAIMNNCHEHLCTSLCGHLFLLLLGMHLGIGIAGVIRSSMFNILGNCQTVFSKGYTIYTPTSNT